LTTAFSLEKLRNFAFEKEASRLCFRLFKLLQKLGSGVAFNNDARVAGLPKHKNSLARSVARSLCFFGLLQSFSRPCQSREGYDLVSYSDQNDETVKFPFFAVQVEGTGTSSKVRRRNHFLLRWGPGSLVFRYPCSAVSSEEDFR